MIPAIILAAGESRRMGRPKALLPIGRHGETFVTRLLATLRQGGAEDLIVVVGAAGDAVRGCVEGCPIPARVVENKRFELGQLSSLVVALDVVDKPGVRAVMAMPVDMPLVTAGTVRAMRAAYLETGSWVVRPAAGVRHGHPVLFDRALFDELRAADPRLGARAVVAAHPARVLDVQLETPDEGAFVDIDTPEEYRRWVGAL